MINNIEIKGTNVGVVTIIISSFNKEDIIRDLTKWISKSSKFFNGTAVVLQLEDNCKFNLEDFKKIIEFIKKNKLIPIGISTLSKNLISLALTCNLRIFHKNTYIIKNYINEKKYKFLNNLFFSKSEKFINNSNFNWIKTRIINRSIRSGEQIYAKCSDLIIFGSVNAGAEVIADGNIQIYGKIRGKALAGATGEINTFIYSSDFNPEMVSIAGYYKVIEDISDIICKIKLRVILKNKKIVFINM